MREEDDFGGQNDASDEEDDEAFLGRRTCVTRCFAPQVVCVWRRKISLPYRAAARQGICVPTAHPRQGSGGVENQGNLPHRCWHNGFVVQYGTAANLVRRKANQKELLPLRYLCEAVAHDCDLLTLTLQTEDRRIGLYSV